MRKFGVPNEVRGMLTALITGPNSLEDVEAGFVDGEKEVVRA
jgi:hypothetical protein